MALGSCELTFHTIFWKRPEWNISEWFGQPYYKGAIVVLRSIKYESHATKASFNSSEIDTESTLKGKVSSVTWFEMDDFRYKTMQAILEI